MELKIDGLAKEAILDAEKVNNGVWIHLDSVAPDPETGQTYPVYLNGDPEKPQRALVRSNRCDAIKVAEDLMRKKGFTKIRLAKKKERDDVISENSMLKNDEHFSLILVAFDNLSAAAPGIQQVSKADALEVYKMTKLAHIVEQVRSASFEDDLYLETEDTPAGNASTSASKTKTSTATDQNQPD